MSYQLSELAQLAWTQLWQVTTVAMISLLLVRVFCRHRPHLAYVLLLLVVVKCLTLPIWSSPVGVFSWSWVVPTRQNQIKESTTKVREAKETLERRSEVIDMSVAGVRAEDAVAAHTDLTPVRKALGLEVYLLLTWTFGALVCGAYVAATWLRHLRAIQKTSMPSTDCLTTLCQQVGEKIGLKRRVQLLVSSESYGPSCFGVFLPSVVLPEQLVTKVLNENIEPVLAHELIHIRRGDTLVALLQVLAGIVWWFHPLVWLVSRQMTREREKCCDAEVVASMSCNPEKYAQSILHVLRFKRSWRPTFLAVGIRPVDVTKERLETIMSGRYRLHSRTSWFCWLILIVGAMFVVPAQSQVVGPAIADKLSGQSEETNVKGKETTEDRILHEKWSNLAPVQVEMITRRHLNGLMRAAHGYHDEHGTLPPAAVPNPNLSPEKRLSGLVLLLPYFDQESWFETGRKSFEHDQIVKAKAIYDSIDMTKAWDDPVNMEAGKTLVPAFLAPGSGQFLDKNGYAVSNFALVRGFDGTDDGIFTDTLIKLSDVTDGTSATLAIGQINSNLGPWIAAGLSTSRHMYHPSHGKNPSFGSPFRGAGFFALCDSSTHLLDLERTTLKGLQAISTRSGEELVPADEFHRFSTGYRSIAEWKKISEGESPVPTVATFPVGTATAATPPAGWSEAREEIFNRSHELLKQLQTDDRFNLEEGEVLKFVSADINLETLNQLRRLHSEGGKRTAWMDFHPMGGQLAVVGWTYDGRTITEIFDSVLGLKVQYVKGDTELLKKKLLGDWLYRRDPREPHKLDPREVAVVADAISKGVDGTCQLELKTVEQPVYVATGDYQFNAVPGPDGKVHRIEGPVAEKADGDFWVPARRRKYSGRVVHSFDEFLDVWGEVLLTPIVDEVSKHPNKTDFFLRFSDKAVEELTEPLATATEKDVIMHFTKQTGLVLKKETRPIQVLFVRRGAASTP